MSLYDNCYVKTVNDPTYWHVVKGERTKVENVEQMHRIGILHIHALSVDELEAIPIKGAKKAKKDAKEEKREPL